MNLRIILCTCFAFFLFQNELQAKPLLSDFNEDKVSEKKNLLIFRASDTLLRFSRNSESYRLGGGFQRRLSSGTDHKNGRFSKSLGSYLEYQSNHYGDDKRDQVLRAYMGFQIDYNNSDSHLNGAFAGIYPAISIQQGHGGDHKTTQSTVGGLLVEAGKTIALTTNLIYRPSVGYRHFANRNGEVLIRPLEFAIQF